VTRRDHILAELGLTPLWCHRERLAEAKVTQNLQASDDSRSESIQVSAIIGPESVSSMDWPALREAASHCTACVLHEKRKQAVLGVGDEKADWLFVGEGPGAEEDARGEPFVGQAGRLLDNMLAAIGLKRGKNVYIANVVKCRPPGNRNPVPDETQACQSFLDRQIALIEPRLIVALGKVSANTLLGRSDTLGSMRSTVHEFRGIPLIVTYHPAYLLRTLTDKAKAWEDLCFAVDTMSAKCQATNDVE
jgi:uracil-DNA glycosylase family 4